MEMHDDVKPPAGRSTLAGCCDPAAAKVIPVSTALWNEIPYAGENLKNRFEQQERLLRPFLALVSFDLVNGGSAAGPVLIRKIEA